MSATLDKGCMLAFAVDPCLREKCDLFRQKVPIVRRGDPLRILKAGVDYHALALKLLPLDRELIAIDIETLAILSDGIEQRTGHLCRQVRPAKTKSRRLDRKRRVVAPGVLITNAP